MFVSIEMDDSVAGYGKTHATGCRDLRDAESLGDCHSRSDVASAIEDRIGWERTAEEVSLSRCVNFNGSK